MFVVKKLYPGIKCNRSAGDIAVLCCFQYVRLMAAAYENSEKSHDNILIVLSDQASRSRFGSEL